MQASAPRAACSRRWCRSHFRGVIKKGTHDASLFRQTWQLGEKGTPDRLVCEGALHERAPAQMAKAGRQQVPRRGHPAARRAGRVGRRPDRAAGVGVRENHHLVGGTGDLAAAGQAFRGVEGLCSPTVSPDWWCSCCWCLLANYGETWLESSSHAQSPVSAADYRGAYAVQQFEPEFMNFEFHDETARWAVYAYSISYFVLFPLVAVGVLVALARRKELAPFRVLCLAVTADYLVSLPWFLFFPVPERWAYPESNAILLSDLWTSNLIAAIRPISALNNCFPSTHVSFTVIVLVCCWLFKRAPPQYHHGDWGHRHPCHVRARHSLVRRHHRGGAGWRPEHGDRVAIHRHLRAPGAGAGISVRPAIQRRACLVSL